MAFLPKNIIKESPLKKEKLKDNIFLKIFIGIILLAMISLMFPSTEYYEHEYKVGTVWINKDLIASFSFPILKDTEQYEREKLEAISVVPKVFNIQENSLSNQLENLKSIITTLREISIIKKQRNKNLTPEDSLSLNQLLNSLPTSFTDQDINFLKQKIDLGQIENTLLTILHEILERGVINLSYNEIGMNKIAIRKGTTETIIPISNIFDIENAHKIIEQNISEKFSSDQVSSPLIKILTSVLQPNLIFNKIETEKLREAAKENVPRTVGFVQQNERIVSKHERITAETKLKLESFSKAKADRATSQTPATEIIGIVIHATLILMLYTIYLFVFRKKIYHDNSKLSLIAIIILLQAFFAYLSIKIEVNAPIQYLIFLPASSMLLTIIFDSRVGYYGTVVTAFLIAAIRGNDYEISLASLIAGALAVYTVRDIRQRTQIFRSLLFIFAGYFFSITGLALQRTESFSLIIQELTFAFANAVFSPVLTYGLLIFFEKSFRVSTDLTLLELSDQNHPLLKMLREKAPGTFHHSMTLGTLSEAAADSIEANAILARVGAYYHDIGKAIKPEYFAENEMQRKSRHQRLTARMSSLVIISHVKEGIELAREYGLPESVINFIPQHHGTTRTSFFFDKAIKQAAARQAKSDVREEDYKYPGPKPQSKEAGIVMLADVVEAVTRTIEDPTPQKLEAAIDDKIKMRFIEGQLDECELTLRDLTKIKQAFLKILIGIYHQRIKYPEQKEEKVELEIKSKEQEQGTETPATNVNEKPVDTFEQPNESGKTEIPSEYPPDKDEEPSR